MLEMNEATEKIIKFYKWLYKKRFLISPEENFDYNALSLLMTDIAKNNLSLEQIEEILIKAIVWFLLIHDSTGKNGTVYQKSLRLLVQQGWLLKICMENTRSLDLDSLLNFIKDADNIEKLAEHIKSGKLKNNQDASLKMVQDLILRVENSIKVYDLKGSELRQHPKIVKLYQNDFPSTEYLNQATLFLATLIDRVENGS